LIEIEGSSEPLSVRSLYDQDDLDRDTFYLANSLIDLLAEVGLRGFSAPFVYIENPTQAVGDGMAFTVIQTKPMTLTR
jgi:hypothetical protein